MDVAVLGVIEMGDRRRCRSEAGRRGGRQARTKQVRTERKNERSADGG